MMIMRQKMIFMRAEGGNQKGGKEVRKTTAKRFSSPNSRLLICRITILHYHRINGIFYNYAM